VAVDGESDAPSLLARDPNSKSKKESIFWTEKCAVTPGKRNIFLVTNH